VGQIMVEARAQYFFPAPSAHQSQIRPPLRTPVPPNQGPGLLLFFSNQRFLASGSTSLTHEIFRSSARSAYDRPKYPQE